MNESTITIIVVLTLLVIFLTLLTILKYAVKDNFKRTRLIMTAFLVFIIMTLTISFWRYALPSLQYTIPAFFVGGALGYNIGVRAAERKLATHGIAHYMEHFHHVHIADVRSMSWWSIVNFYSIMGGLVLINLVGLSTVLFGQYEWLALGTSMVGAFLIGTIVPYIIHLWSVKHERI